jgi:tRNA (adenine37-N6)-methyltransferase
MEKYTIRPIGKIKTPFRRKGEAPRQPEYSGGAEGIIEIYKEYSQGLKGLENYNYIVVLFYFDRPVSYSLTARPPGSSEARGVFASRSPHRPNHIGLSVLRLLKVEGTTLRVKNVDMLDDTPVIDIKPYIENLDNIEDLDKS